MKVCVLSSNIILKYKMSIICNMYPESKKSVNMMILQSNASAKTKVKMHLAVLM